MLVHKHRIMRFMKHCERTPALVKSFQSLVSLEKLQSMEIKQAVAHLRRPDVVEAAKKLLLRLHWRCVGMFKHDKNTGDVNVRQVLAAYMIMTDPNHLFEDLSEPLTVQLIPRAEKLVNILDGPHVDPHPEFLDALYDYMEAFNKWKTPDKLKLRGRIEPCLRGLYSSFDTSRAEEFSIQIWRMKLKLQCICGSQTVEDFDALNAPPAGLIGFEALHEQLHSELVSLIATYRSDPSPALLPRMETIRAGLVALDKEPTVLPSDLRELCVKQLKPNVVQNETLTHGLLLWGSKFRIDDNGRFEGVDYIEMGAMKEAFFESLLSDLKLKAYGRIPIILRDLVAGFNDIKHPRDPVLLSEEEILMLPVENINHVAHRIFERTRANLAAEYDGIVSDDFESLIVLKLKFMIKAINLGRIDLVNKRLQSIEPVISEHGVMYEQSKFAEKLNLGLVALDPSWLGGASSFIDAMVRLVSTDMKVPSTLELDAHRIKLLRLEFKAQVAEHVERTIADIGLDVSQVDEIVATERVQTAARKFVASQWLKVLEGHPINNEAALKLKRIADINILVHGQYYMTVLGQRE